MSTYKQVIDPYSGRREFCLQPCTDYTYQAQTTTSSYPAATTFLSSQEACMLVIKFFEVCKDTARRDTLDVKYPTICATSTDSAFKNKFRDKFISLQLETDL